MQSWPSSVSPRCGTGETGTGKQNNQDLQDLEGYPYMYCNSHLQLYACRGERARILFTGTFSCSTLRETLMSDEHTTVKLAHVRACM